MSSNYPPGVTGNEDIFGPQRSFVGSRECGRLLNEGEPDEEECPFSGDVDIDVYSTYHFWECPDCGCPHEEDREQ